MRTLALSAILLVAVPATAQTYHTSPNNLLTTEGNGASHYLAGYLDARHQLLDGELRGKAGAIKSVAFRVDYRAHTTTAAMGRAWQKVTLKISNCDRDKESKTFSQNPTSTPAMVFNNRAAFPTLNGNPATRPAPWGAATGHLSFPFSSAWVNTGAADICLDFDFTGGTLANSAPWTTGQLRGYYLDGYLNPPNIVNGPTTEHGKSRNAGGCKDSNGYQGLGAYCQLDSTTFTKNSTTHPGKSRLSVTSLATGPNKPVIHGFTLGGNKTGITFGGVTCNKLYLDLTKPSVVNTRTVAGSAAVSQYDLAVFPYTASLAGKAIYAQAAWADSKTNALKLSNASSTVIPVMPRIQRRSCVYTNVPANKNGDAIGIFRNPDYSPAIRYER